MAVFTEASAAVCVCVWLWGVYMWSSDRNISSHLRSSQSNAARKCYLSLVIDGKCTAVF